MKVIINPKRCDISPACGGIEVCPTNALYWDEENSNIGFEESKCIGCGQCADACPVRVIHLARTKSEEDAILKEIADDPRTTEELRVDRYGADFIDTQETESDKVIIPDTGITVLELNNEDLINCLLMSVPMSELFGKDGWNHIKVMNPTDELLSQFGVSELPALVVFRGGKQIGKIEGFYEDNSAEKQVLIKKIKDILG